MMLLEQLPLKGAVLLSVISLACAFALPRGTSTTRKEHILDLQNQHHPLSPVETIKSIEIACTELGIDKFDVYGDYTEGK